MFNNTACHKTEFDGIQFLSKAADVQWLLISIRSSNFAEIQFTQ